MEMKKDFLFLFFFPFLFEKERKREMGVGKEGEKRRKGSRILEYRFVNLKENEKMRNFKNFIVFSRLRGIFYFSQGVLK